MHRWVPLDAAFKDKAYRQDIDVNVSFDYGFDSGDYLAARSDQLPHERYARDVETAALAQGKDLADLSPEGGIRPLKLDILPASLPYTVTSFTLLTGAASVEPSTLPGAHRYALDVTVKSGSTALLTRSVSYPDAALKRLTLSFTPADASSQTWWDGWNGSFATLPASGVNVKPVLKLEGAEVAGSAAGSTALTSSNLLTTIIRLSLPDSDWGTQCIADSGTGNDPDVTCVNKTVYDNIKPGGYHALQAHAFQTSDRYLKERAQQLIDAVRANPAPTPAAPAAYDATLGEFLHLALAKYLRYGVDSSKQVGDQMNVAGQRGNDIGLTTVDLKTEYLFDQPYAIKAGGLLIDVKGGQSRFTKLDTAATTAAALRDEIWPAFKLALYSGSAFEHYIWQEMARTDAVSTVRGLQFARQAGTASDIVTLNAANIAQYDTLMDASMAPYKTQITNYVNAGATVTVPKKKLAYSAEGSGEVWNGAVYMAENQGQGSFGALISGNFGGGYGALTPSPLLTDFNVNYSLIDPAIPSSLLGSGTSYFSLY
ncbi:MAG: type IV secretion protein Rhs, partial [Candidatus Thermoplasmatota archaeon]|nr:type IV secretion protein Rhs [Candidatus Thermoplasmatota archaeon]